MIAIFASALLMVSCKGDNKTVRESHEAHPDTDTAMTDTMVTDAREQLISTTPMPRAADELFDDFLFNFTANRKLQMERVQFPLPVVRNGHISYINKADWKMEQFFMPQGYYTLIFDNIEQMEVVKDTSVSHVVIEKIFFDTKSVTEYTFDRINSVWMLCSITQKTLEENVNASFLTFYQRFSTDSAFQMQSLHDPVAYTGPDPDDDFGQIEEEIAPEEWIYFTSDSPSNTIYNILYGQTYTDDRHKVFVIRGISNGLEVDMTFERKNGKWMLTGLTS